MGLVSFRSPLAELVGTVLAKTDLKSVFCLVVFFIVIFVLAYLTNPTESSFRTYLTEQSFRQHLSRLDDNADDDYNKEHSRSSSRRTAFSSAHNHSFDNSSAFHFANRASVSLRTPKHVFHSFGLFTISAIVPTPKYGQTDERDSPMICDSWYIGAFGRWWRGGIIEAWYQDVIARSKDEEGWSSGILNMKNLDMLNDFNGLPFSTKNLPPHLLSRGSPPKLRNRDRASQRPALPPPRSTTPPPLPKSASLPLHTTRLPSTTFANPPQLPLLNHGCHPVDPVAATGSPLISRSPSTLFDHSPRIAEVLRQISLSKTAVLDIRNQLGESQTSASQTHSLLQSEVESLRERKRQEDASKLESKSRTKTLDDSKRHAESTKRDIDKKLKVAQTARDTATQRINHLDKEMSLLKQRAVDDEALIRQSGETVSEAETELVEALEQKKQEIKAAEDVVAALNQRARELEEKLTDEKQRLENIKEQKRTQEIEQALLANQLAAHHDSPTSWQSVAYGPPESIIGSSVPEFAESPQSQADFELGTPARRSSFSGDNRVSAHPVNIAPGSQRGSPTAPFNTVNAAQGLLRANGYSVLDDKVIPLPLAPYQQKTTTFSPFSDMDHDAPMVSPTTQSLVPSALIASLDGDGFSRSFQSESDLYIDRDWRGNNVASYAPPKTVRVLDNQISTMGSLTSSPVSPHGAHDYEHDPFEVRFMGDYARDHHLTSDAALDLHHAAWAHRASNSDPSSAIASADLDQSQSAAEEAAAAPRRWFSTIGMTKEKPKKGLNPDAKVFSFSRKSQSSTGPVAAAPAPASSPYEYDALNPNGLGSTMSIPPSTSSNSSSLLRAFAPSPAEREALQRALGGSSNTSFERLPSLSIPSSPKHVHAHVPQQHSQGGLVLPSWLQSFPMMRKPTSFSPWDDDETTMESGVAEKY